MDIIEIERALLYVDIVGIGIGFMCRGVIGIRLEGQSGFDNAIPLCMQLPQKQPKRLVELVFIAIDIQMVGISRGDDGNIRIQGEERPVKFIGLDDHDIITGKKHIGAIICAYATEEGRASKTTVGKDMRDQRGCSGLTMGTGYSDREFMLADQPQYLRTFKQSMARLPETVEYLLFAWHGWCIDDQRMLIGRLEGSAYLGKVVDVVYRHAFRHHPTG